jgi:hypothetical protein
MQRGLIASLRLASRKITEAFHRNMQRVAERLYSNFLEFTNRRKRDCTTKAMAFDDRQSADVPGQTVGYGESFTAKLGQ